MRGVRGAAPASLPDALAVIERYERATGLAGATRSVESIVALMFPEIALPGTRPQREPVTRPGSRADYAAVG